jgi:phosphatidylinositol alpha-1,6-mannosyltransferase
VPSVVYTYGKEIGASPNVARFAIRTSSLVIAISRYTRDLVLAAGAREDRIRLIPPGVDIVDPEETPKRDTPTVVTVARLEDRYKGHDVMVRALPLIRARVPDAEWVVIGEGPLRADIARLAATTRSSNGVKMLGSVSNAQRDSWLGQAHVFCMPSRLPAGQAAGEGFGIVYLEAGLHRLPVVAGCVGGSIDAVEDGVTGVLVDPANHLAVANAISDLLLDPVRAAEMGARGATHARTFTWDRIAAQVEDTLFEAANMGRG